MSSNIISYKNEWAYLSLPREKANPNAHLTREPSICKSRGGLVLHSANLRSTAFISDPKEAAAVVKKFSRLKTTKARSALVDSYFSE